MMDLDLLNADGLDESIANAMGEYLIGEFESADGEYSEAKGKLPIAEAKSNTIRLVKKDRRWVVSGNFKKDSRKKVKQTFTKRNLKTGKMTKLLLFADNTAGLAAMWERIGSFGADGDFSDANGYEDVNLQNLDLSANGMNLQDLDLGANGDYSYCCGVDGDDSNANGFRFGNLRARLNRMNRPVRVRARRGDGEINADGYNAYSEADGEYSYFKVTPEQAKMAADVGGKLLANVKRKPKTELESNLKAACGRKPLFGKSKKKKYQECATKFMANAEKSKTSAAEATARAKEAEARTAEAKAAEAKTTAESSRLAAPPTSDKFLGMPKAVGITVVAVGGLALLVGGFFLIKKMKAQQVAVK